MAKEQPSEARKQADMAASTGGIKGNGIKEDSLLS